MVFRKKIKLKLYILRQRIFVEYLSANSSSCVDGPLLKLSYFF